MSLYVQKFGGSSVADAEKMLHVAHIIQDIYEQGNAVIVVLSAQGDTTDCLLDAAREVSGNPSQRELDVLLSTGEQASVALCAMALERIGVPAVSLCAWQVPVLTDGTYGEADILAIGRERILRELSEHRVVLVAGFQGVSEDGEITTLGRGGSDLSAVALAAAFDADVCQIYTDVDGVYTTDPRLCATARHLDQVPFDDMLMLARHGAQVLHDKSVALAQRCGVTIEVHSCEKNGAFTRVDAEESKCAVTGVTRRVEAQTELAGITAVGRNLPAADAERACIEALEQSCITVYGIEEGEMHITVFVHRNDADAALCIVHDTLIRA